ncbi:FAD-binding oxidoreductase [Roseomonas sp. M0104]|uniref:FAD-binding oxidoreductase n=1 Tax=Teichococcus coralli TaxID=2545983 RepID=A0A845B841_9PROT|nr:FAD-binding oxidoreductase [Pseudoroseomonas coralli]
MPSLADFIERPEREMTARFPMLTPVVYGHAWDGSLHRNLRATARTLPNQLAVSEASRTALYDIVDAHGGSFSAEHGVGRPYKGHVAARIPAGRVQAMRREGRIGPGRDPEPRSGATGLKAAPLARMVGQRHEARELGCRSASTGFATAMTFGKAGGRVAHIGKPVSREPHPKAARSSNAGGNHERVSDYPTRCAGVWRRSARGRHDTRHASRGAGLAKPSHHHGCSVSSGRNERHDGSADRLGSREGPRPDDRR